MWLLTWLPNSIFHFVVLAGFLGLFVSFAFGFIPFVGRYSLPIKLVSILVLIFGFFMEGAISNQAYWEAKVKDAQIQVAQKETKAVEATVKVVTKYIDKVKIVKEKQDVIIKEVPKYITKEVDAGCTIPDSIRVLHSRASRNEISESTGSIDGSSTGTTEGSGSK